MQQTSQLGSNSLFTRGVIETKGKYTAGCAEDERIKRGKILGANLKLGCFHSDKKETRLSRSV